MDSYLGFATSLKAARRGLWYSPTPRYEQNTQTDIHINTTGFENGEDIDQPIRSVSTMLRHVPHYLLSRVVTAPSITVYILFPHLPVF